MKSGKISWALLFMGILLLLAGIILGKSVVNKGLNVNGAYTLEKVMVSAKNQHDAQHVNSLSLEDIKELARQLQMNELTYTCTSGLMSSSVSGNNSSCTVKITGTNYLYPMFKQLRFEYGSFFTHKSETEGGNVAVIEETVAWNLFKTKNAVGKTLQVYDVPFKVVGVFAKDHSIIGTLTDSGIPDVFIPGGKLLELDGTAKINSFQVRTIDSSTLDHNTALVSEALQRIGKSISGYYIEDYNLKKALMEQKPGIIVFIMGLLAICIFLSQIKNTLKEVINLITCNCRLDYFSHVIKKYASVLGIAVLKILISIGCIVCIWIGIRTAFYIPPKYIADELINVSYYVDLFKGSVKSSISSLGYIAPNAELVMDTLGAVLNWIFYVSLIVGFVLVYLGFSQVKTADITISRLILYLGLFVAASMLILAVAAYWLGLPFTMDVKSLMIAWGFLSITSIKMSGSIKPE